MYGKKNFNSVNKLRLELFLQKYKPKNGGVISCVKKMDGSFLPPCYQVLKQKINRTNLITGKWLSSVLPNPPDLAPTHSGWILDSESRYKINWFEGDMSPRCLDVYTEEDDEAEILEGNFCEMLSTTTRQYIVS